MASLHATSRAASPGSSCLIRLETQPEGSPRIPPNPWGIQARYVYTEKCTQYILGLMRGRFNMIVLFAQALCDWLSLD